jgi:hypothetical protein
MSAVPYEGPQENWATEDQDALVSPGRRRKFWTKRTAALTAVIIGAAGFYGGVRVEKSQLSGATTTAAAAPAGGTGAAGAAAGAGPRAGFGGGGGGGAFAGGNASVGKIASVNGNTLYLTDNTGNTLKVTLSSSTKVSKSLPVGKSSVQPGDTVVIQGLKNSKGTIVATSVSDSGAGTAGRAGGAGRSTGTSSPSGTTSTSGN